MQAPRLTFAVLLLAVGIQTSCQTEILSDDNDICRLFQDGVSMRKPGYCNKVIKCVNHKSVDVETCDKSKPYATTQGTCTTTPRSVDDYCKAPCKAKSPTYEVDPKNCQGWYQCNVPNDPYFGYCPDGMNFNQTKGVCVYSNFSTCKATYQVCDVAPTNKRFKDEENCNKYYQCQSSAKEKSFTCPTGQYYNVDTALCVPKAQIPCGKHPYPENVCGTTKLAIRGRFVSDGATCRGYFYCKDKGSGVPDTDPHWGQCDSGKFFNEETATCLTRTHVNCEEDRCDGRESGKELSATHGCHNYLVCQNNFTQAEAACGSGLYFDPIAEECTSKAIALPICS